MDFRYLRAFLDAADAESLSAAAKKQRIAVSAISRQISLFEESVGGPCFKKMGRGVQLTELGQSIFMRARSFEESTDSAIKLAQEAPLRVGCLQSVFEGLLVEAIMRMRKTDPKLSLTITIGSPKYLQDLLLKGWIDCALNTRPVERFHNEPLAKEELVMVTKNAKLFQDLSSTCWVIYTPLEAAWAPYLKRHKPACTIRLNSLNAVIDLAERGNSVAIVPEGPSIKRHTFHRQKLIHKTNEQILLVWPTTGVENDRFRALQAALTNAASAK